MGFQKLRTLVAFLIAPWATILLVWMRAPVDSTIVDTLVDLGGGSILVAAFTYPALLLGIPLWYLFRWRGIRSWIWYALAGGVIGAAYLSWLNGPDLSTAGGGFCLGMASGTLFKEIDVRLEKPLRFPKLRTLVAFLIAPWATVILVMLILMLELNADLSPRTMGGVWSVGGDRWAVLVVFLAYSALLAGIPIWYVFRRRGIRSWVWYAFAGGGAGIVYMFPLLLSPLSRSGLTVPDLGAELAFACLCGTASAMLFRAFYRSAAYNADSTECESEN